MDDAGFIIGGYAAAFVAIGAYALTLIRRGRSAAAKVPDEEKPWT